MKTLTKKLNREQLVALLNEAKNQTANEKLNTYRGTFVEPTKTRVNTAVFN